MPTRPSSSIARSRAAAFEMSLCACIASIELVADAVEGVQRRERVLEDHRDLLAADPAQLVVGQRDEVTALEQDRAPDVAPCGWSARAWSARETRLARARLADDPRRARRAGTPQRHSDEPPRPRRRTVGKRTHRSSMASSAPSSGTGVPVTGVAGVNRTCGFASPHRRRRGRGGSRSVVARPAGGAFGIVGESGSGKSVTAVRHWPHRRRRDSSSGRDPLRGRDC